DMEKGKRGYRYDEAFKREAIALVIEKHIPLSNAAKQLGVAEETLRQWIADGAEWKEHWSFSAPVKREPPAVKNTAWVRNAIDRFILAKLEQEGLTPAPEADRRALIRRVSLDLTGLPPTPAEVDAFVNDRAANAYEKLVDRLLASPHYGERMAQRWLDVVRFAETDGFEYDTHRNDAWRFRDYVIRSIQQDKPFDRFLQEQLAGDEMFPGDNDALIASGLQRLGPLRKNAGNQEVASSRNEVLTEMTNLVGSGMLGVTLG
ncbi:MAG: DUF1549 domain-containing protein, partial [Bryobacterales bacterium]|nr:DUF1549 domain-containing protein [Bryobacterales bacterium]